VPVDGYYSDSQHTVEHLTMSACAGQLRRFTSGCISRVGRTHYDTLKISHDASSSEIKNRFKKISLKLHPDMLKSQGLSDDELKSKSDEYLRVKKSYEVLADEMKRDEYDLKMGIKNRNYGAGNGKGSGSMHSHFRRPGNTFHFHERYGPNDVPHFDKHKHSKINERLEKRYNYNQKVNQNVDTFGRDLYARNLGKDGPRKGIYKEYHYQPNFRDDEGEGKRMAMKIAGGVIGLLAVWYLLVGNYTTTTNTKGTATTKPPKQQETGHVKEADPVVDVVGAVTAEAGLSTETNKSAKNSETTREATITNTNTKAKGKTMTVNNNYGLRLIKKDIEERDIMREFEEQVAESAE
jgi:curved DNA-binding protein CbpA